MIRALLALALAGGCVSAELLPDRVREVHGELAAAPRRLVAVPATCGSLTPPPTWRAPPFPGTNAVPVREAPEEPAEPEPADEPRPADPFAPATAGDVEPDEAPRRSGLLAEDPVVRDGCDPGHLDVVDATVGVALELRGHDVIDSERVNATTFRYTATTVDGVTEHDRRGARFADAPPAVQRATLDALGATSVVSTRVLVGAPLGLSARRAIEVQVRVVDRRGRLAWARRCAIELGGLASVAVAMQRAARCAGGER